MHNPLVYLDYNATTPVAPDVVEAMLPFFSGNFGNPSSLHRSGRDARNALERAREQIAFGIDAYPDEIVFTGSATEANNLAIFGSLADAGSGAALAVASTEHHAVIHPARQWQAQGAPVTFIAVDRDGGLNTESWNAALAARPRLIAVAAANSEIGTIHPLRELAAAGKERGILFHTDAAQALGKIPFSVRDTGVDMAAFSAHKIFGPKGIGALYIRRGIRISPRLLGGSHERERRAGTEHVAGAVGFAKALTLALARREVENARQAELKSRLWNALRQRIPRLRLHGRLDQSLPGTLNVGFPGIRNEVLLMQLDLRGICVSTGSACASGAAEPSHVIQALGFSRAEAAEAIRFSWGRHTTAVEIDQAAEAAADCAGAVRAAIPTEAAS